MRYLEEKQVEKCEKTLATDNFQPETGPTSPLDDVQPHETCLKWRIEQVVSDAGSVDVAAINTSISIAIDDVAPLESVNAIGDAVGANPFIRFLSSLRHQSRDLPLKFVFPLISRRSDANLILVGRIGLHSFRAVYSLTAHFHVTDIANRPIEWKQQRNRSLNCARPVI